MSSRAATVALFAVAAISLMAWWQAYQVARYVGAPTLPKSPGPVTV